MPTYSDHLRIAQRIRTHRQAKDISPDDMARLMDMSATTYRKLEAGSRSLTVRNLERLAEILDVTPSELVPSMGSGKYTVTQQNTNNDSSNGSVTFNEYNSNVEHQLWQELCKAKDAIIAAQLETIETLKMSFNKI